MQVDNVTKRSSGKSNIILPGGRSLLIGDMSISAQGDFIYITDAATGLTHTVDFNNTNLDKHSQTSAEALMNYWIDNNFFFSRVGGSGGVIAINANHVFTLFTDRDEYFDPTLPVGNPTDNTAELIANNTLILITGEGTDNIIQRWDGVTDPTTYENSNWTDVTDTVRGPAGADGTDGRTVLNGAVDPTTEGVDGDFYINTATNTIFGPKASGSWPSGTSLVGPTGPTGPSEIFETVTFTTALTLNPANLTTYNRKDVTYIGTAIVTVTLDTIANFLADPEDDIQYRIINESDAALSITAGTGDTFGATSQQTISIQRGQSLYIKMPTSGTRWDILGGQTNLSGGTQPLRPQPPTTGEVILQTALWDASSGSFPSGIISSGYLYRISNAGTVDNETFFIDDLLLAITDSPSTSTFADNWHRIDGDEYVHSWAGLTGVIDDDNVRTVLTRLGFQLISPSAHNFTIDIPSRVDTNTDLNVQHIVNYEVSNRASIASITLIVTVGDNKTLTVPTRDGSQSETVTLSGISTTAPGTVTFVIQITDSNGTTHDSNTITITVNTPADHEQTHFGFILSTEDQTDIVFANDDIEARDQADGTYTVSGIPSDSNLYRLYWAVPTASGSISSVTQSGFNISNQFTAVNNFTIGGETYNIFLMNAASAVNSNYNNTILIAS